MGKRGPTPRSGIDFRGKPVVLRARIPSILVTPHEPAYALADARGYVSIHRLIASETQGRWLTRGEAVRVVDGDPWNWQPSNLRVVALVAHLSKQKP